MVDQNIGSRMLNVRPRNSYRNASPRAQDAWVDLLHVEDCLIVLDCLQQPGSKSRRADEHSPAPACEAQCASTTVSWLASIPITNLFSVPNRLCLPFLMRAELFDPMGERLVDRGSEDSDVNRISRLRHMEENEHRCPERAGLEATDFLDHTAQIKPVVFSSPSVRAQKSSKESIVRILCTHAIYPCRLKTLGKSLFRLKEHHFERHGV